MDLFKRCPACGKRFVVTRGAKALVDRETGVMEKEHLAGSPYGGKGSGTWVAVKDDVPVEYDKYRTDYTCKNCHHTWTEPETETRRT